MNQNYDRKTVAQLINSYFAATAKLKATNSYEGLKHFDSLRENCLWRIAIETEMFDVDAYGKLTDNQWNQLINFINQLQHEKAA